jgi:hypothetical protein
MIHKNKKILPDHLKVLFWKSKVQVSNCLNLRILSLSLNLKKMKDGLVYSHLRNKKTLFKNQLKLVINPTKYALIQTKLAKPIQIKKYFVNVKKLSV